MNPRDLDDQTRYEDGLANEPFFISAAQMKHVSSYSAVLCSQCKGTGVNSVDHFNGQFKAGSICWLCSGKKDILCGGCNGAGFMGGFMSTADS
ncbi:hypothetical protein SDJN02_08736, partial [Cucurbita argyrosperma subsp. argyrosperma]